MHDRAHEAGIDRKRRICVRFRLLGGTTGHVFEDVIHAGDDALVSVKNSIAFYLALQKNKVPAGMHIFPKGQHGFFMEPAHSNWFEYCSKWLQENGWVNQGATQR